MAFCVTKSNGTIVKPSETTPTHRLSLSFIDRIQVLRCYVRTLHVYKHGVEASRVIEEALSRALVPYYPLAGRLEETDRGELQINCSGQGVRFVQATADCSLDSVDYFYDTASIPYEKLLLDQPSDSLGMDPLLLIQVTDFECGGFVMGLTFCHAVGDGLGSAQFLNAVGEMARGVEKLTVAPVWHRDFVQPPPPPSTQQQEPNTDDSNNNNKAEVFPDLAPPVMPGYRLEQTNVDVSMDEINQLKREFKESTDGGTCSSFEILAACLWSARTRAIKLDKNTEVTLVFFANCRHLLQPPPPQGFYGNCFFPVTVRASSDTVASNGIPGVVKLVQEGKAKLSTEFTKWVNGKLPVDPFAPPLAYTTLFVSEWARLGFNWIDYGWGPPAHVVPVQGSSVIPAAIVSFGPDPLTGFRLMTWAVEEAHLRPFLNEMNTVVATTCI